MSNQIVAGSVAAVARRAGVSVAIAWLDVEHVILVDCSASMNADDSRGGRRRFDVALEELARLQSELPGRIGIVAFSNTASVVPGGVPPFEGANTDLAAGLRLAKTMDVGGVQFVVISDGEPDSDTAALGVAAGIKGAISGVYVGPEGGGGAAFLARLAKANGGTFAQSARVGNLADTIRPLLGAS